MANSFNIIDLFCGVGGLSYGFERAGFKVLLGIDNDKKATETFTFDQSEKVGYADSAYVGKNLPKYIRNEVCEKGYRNKPLSEEQKENNRHKSKIRCRIEHVFAFMTMSMQGLTVRSMSD